MRPGGRSTLRLLRAWRHVAFSLAFVGFLACGGSSGPGPVLPDGGTTAVELEIGGGEFQFVPYTAGGAIEVVCGPQGGQHIWISVRGRGFDPANVGIVVEIRLADTGARVCGQQLDEVRMFPNGDWLEYTGIICFVPDPELIRGRSVQLEARITDGASRMGSATVTGISMGPDRSCALTP